MQTNKCFVAKIQQQQTFTARRMLKVAAEINFGENKHQSSILNNTKMKIK
jgi:hypothetical protein